VVAAPLAAQEKGKKKGQAAEPAAFQLPDTIQLSADQQAQLNALKKEYGPKLQALQKRVSDVFTQEQRKARREATKAARDAGKKNKEIRQAADAAVTLTAEQQKQLDAAEAEQQKLSKEVRGKVEGLLTDAQKAELKTKAKKKSKKAA
jgi:hypothetical protein